MKAATYFFPKGVYLQLCNLHCIVVTVHDSSSCIFHTCCSSHPAGKSYRHWGPRLYQCQSISHIYAFFCKSSSYLIAHLIDQSRLISFIVSVFRLKSCMYIFPFLRIKIHRSFLTSVFFLISQACIDTLSVKFQRSSK